MTRRLKRAMRSRPATMVAILWWHWQASPCDERGEAAYRAYKDAHERKHDDDERKRRGRK